MTFIVISCAGQWAGLYQSLWKDSSLFVSHAILKPSDIAFLTTDEGINGTRTTASFSAH